MGLIQKHSLRSLFHGSLVFLLERFGSSCRLRGLDNSAAWFNYSTRADFLAIKTNSQT